MSPQEGMLEIIRDLEYTGSNQIPTVALPFCPKW